MSDVLNDRAAHWDAVYGRLGEEEVSWFEPEPALSLELLDLAGVACTDPSSMSALARHAWWMRWWPGGSPT